MGAGSPVPRAVVATRVTTRARQEAIGVWRGDRLEVRLTSPPAEGRANEALCRLLARALGVAPSRVQVIRGGRNREKLVHVSGMTTADALRRLQHPRFG